MKILVNILLALVISLLMFILIVPVFFSGRVAVVLTGSMEPTLPQGSLAFTMPVKPKEIEIDDIIVFIRPGTYPEVTTSHRVVEIVSTDGELSFRTKGDANDEPDPSITLAEHVRGRVVFNTPYLGRVMNFTLSYVKNWVGLVLLVALPSLVIVGSAVRGMHRPRSRRQKRLDLLRKRQRRWRRR